MKVYPEYIYEKVRQREGFKPNDKSIDKEIKQYTSNAVFRDVLNWEGLINYDSQIKSWIKDIYGVDLDEVSEKLNK